MLYFAKRFKRFGSVVMRYSHSNLIFTKKFGALFFEPLKTSKLPPTPTKIPFVK